MDKFLQLSADDLKKQNPNGRIPFHPRITSERIEKLKKTFQPFWMREMALHPSESRSNPNSHDGLNQI